MKKKKHEESEELQKLDWRMHAATTISKDADPNSGYQYKKGDAVKTYIEVKYSKGTVGFGVPNPIAMYLNLSHTLINKAESLFHILPLKQKVKQRQILSDDTIVFDFYESLFGSIVMAYTSIEAFANEYIPEDYNYERKIKDKIQILNKSDIERRVNLDEKLLNILPDIFEINFTKQSPKWEKYKILQNNRDRIIHFKSKDIYPDRTQILQGAQMKLLDNIWNSLLNESIFDAHKIAIDIISHFMNNRDTKKQPRWFKKYPHL